MNLAIWPILIMIAGRQIEQRAPQPF